MYGAGPTYLHAVESAGGLPLMIAPNLAEDTLRQIYERLDGVLLIGGGDVDPTLYGLTSADLVELRSVDATRDSSEIALTHWALADDKPLLGVCRGIQVMNVALGGTLYRDIATEYGTVVDHDRENVGMYRLEGHKVTVRDGSRLSVLLGSETVPVNSFHHQAIRELSHELTATALSTDGLVEGVEQLNARFFVGVQWHPEVMYDDSEPMRRLFSGFIAQAGKSVS